MGLMESKATDRPGGGDSLVATAANLPFPDGLRPDRSFDTIACGGAAEAGGEMGGFYVRFAAMTGGAACAVLTPGAARAVGLAGRGWGQASGIREPGPAAPARGLETVAGTVGAVVGAGSLGGPDGRAVPGMSEAPFARVDLYETLAVDAGGRIAVEALRARLAQSEAAGRLRLVANGAAGPYLCRPLKMGADVVVEDLRMWIPPAVLSACGLVEGREPCLVASWTGGKAVDAFIAAFPRPFRELDAGQDAVLASGLATLSLRSQRMSDNALVVAYYLAADERVAWVSYPGLPEDGANDAARRTLEHGFGPYVAFGVAEARSCPASCGAGRPHGETPGAAGGGCDRSRLHRGSAPDGFVLRVGLENPLDIVASLERFLAGGSEADGTA